MEFPSLIISVSILEHKSAFGSEGFYNVVASHSLFLFVLCSMVRLHCVKGNLNVTFSN